MQVLQPACAGTGGLSGGPNNGGMVQYQTSWKASSSSLMTFFNQSCRNAVPTFTGNGIGVAIAACTLAACGLQACVTGVQGSNFQALAFASGQYDVCNATNYIVTDWPGSCMLNHA